MSKMAKDLEKATAISKLEISNDPLFKFEEGSADYQMELFYLIEKKMEALGHR